MVSFWYYTVIVVLIGIGAFLSAAETAYSAANRMRLENAMEAGSRRARIACQILDRFDDALSILLISGNIVNMLASSLGAVVAILIAGGERYINAAAAIMLILQPARDFADFAVFDIRKRRIYPADR